jgi:hypothetical protein
MSDEDADLNFQAPIRSVSLENMVRMRAAVLERLEQALRLFEEAAMIAKQANLGLPVIQICPERHISGTSVYNTPHAREAFRVAVDRIAWNHLLKESGLRTFMDAEARAQWDDQLQKANDVPSFTLENIEATFGALYASRGEMFERGVIRCFKRLSWDYKTNQPFRFGKRIVLNHLFSPYKGAVNGVGFLSTHTTNELDDLLRVFHVLDGKPEPDHRQGMYHQISQVENKAREWDGEYFHLRWFKKGSAHLTFKRMDLVEELNKIIAKHYPGALPDGRRGKERK